MLASNRSLLCAVSLLLLSAAWAGAESIGWRGNGSGIFPQARPPLFWSKEKNVLWKAKLPGHSISSPIVIGDQVFTVAEPASLLCLNTADGELLWQREHDYRSILGEEAGARIEADLAQAKQVREQREALQKEYEEARKTEGEEASKPKFEPRIRALDKQYEELTAYPPVPEGMPGNTTSTPVSDGKTVWTVFGTGIVSAHALDGTRRWAKFVANPRDRHSASPLLVDGLLIVDLRGLKALNAETGEEVWSAETGERAGTAIATKVGETTVIVTPGGEVLRAADGEILLKGLFNLGYCSPIVHEGVIYAVEQGKTIAVRLLPGADDAIKQELVWEQSAARDDRLGSPVYHNGLLYTVTGKGIIDVYDAANGESVYRQRLSISKGRIDPSLALAGGKLFVSSNRGNTLVLEPGKAFKSLSENDLEEFSSSPVFSGQRVYIRTEESLFCLGEAEGK